MLPVFKPRLQARSTGRFQDRTEMGGTVQILVRRLRIGLLCKQAELLCKFPYVFEFVCLALPCKRGLKVPLKRLGILHICNLWILLKQIVIYLVNRKFHLHRLFCC